MDPIEAIARDHLIFRGFAEPVYEPDGNVPPDFVVDGPMAVEVRLLNENERGTSSPQGLEQTRIPVITEVNEQLKMFSAPAPNAWYVRVRFGRPAPRRKEIRSKLREFLERVASGQPRVRETLSIGDTFQLEVVPRSGEGHPAFELFSVLDHEAGGMVVAEVARNAALCISEKSKKIANVRLNYPKWWLILVDAVAYGMSAYDQDQFRREVTISHDWYRVTIVSRLDYKVYFDL